MKLGEGINAIVYDNHDGTVTRISKTTDDGFMALLSIGSEDRDKYDVVKILGHSITNGIGSYMLEKCYPVPKDRMEILKGNWSFINDFHKLPFQIADVELSQCVNKAILLFRLVNKSGMKVNDLDLSPSNIMLSKSGKLVITDPFSTICK
ncbi:hypothetical protein HAYMO_297 [Serratia phage vB_SmaM_Haymo]|nr:hypothetical protein HAYMO_297 [Serratia phage vB_SmaM_Haymo]